MNIHARYALLIIALAAIWLAMLLFGAGPVDRSVYEALYAGGHPALVRIALALTFLGEPTILVSAGFFVAAWLWWKRNHRVAIILLLIVLIGRGFSELQKYWIARARPDLEPHLVIVKTSSFPSGHATSSMIFYLTVALALTADSRWHRAVVAGAILLSLLIGTSRVMLGVHWPSDVIGGWAFGLLWVLLTRQLSERLLRKNSDPNANQL